MRRIDQVFGGKGAVNETVDAPQETIQELA